MNPQLFPDESRLIYANNTLGQGENPGYKPLNGYCEGRQWYYVSLCILWCIGQRDLSQI